MDVKEDYINTKKHGLKSECSSYIDQDEERPVERLDQQVVELYRGVAKVMSNYRSGMLPKAFKIIPTLSNWEQILQLTKPDDWTAASMCEATKIFSSNLKDDMAQRFYNVILLPRLRDDIAEFKKLNFHLYSALRKAIYKPAAFFKGIILPLCEDSSETSMREAVIIGSILKKTHIPLIHSAAAIYKIAEMPFIQSRSIFLMELISKNYALPFKVLDCLVDYFIRYTHNSQIELPVLWHQTLLKFCQKYARDISSDQKEALLELIKQHKHHQITPEIRKAIKEAGSRDIEIETKDQEDLDISDDETDIDS